MTYRELLRRLEEMSDDQLNCDVTVEIKVISLREEDSDFYSINKLYFTNKECDVLDENHPVLIVE